MGSYGLKISIAGKNINSVEPRDYILHSKYASVKIYAEAPNKTYQTISVPAGGSATVSITHGLPFTPMVMLFTEPKPGSGHWYTGAQNSIDPSDNSANVTIADLQTNTYVDGTYIKIKFANATASSKTVKYYYFIFADNG